MNTFLKRVPPLAWVDGIAILLFVVIGGDIHGGVRSAGVLRTALFLLIPWYAAAAFFGLYREPSWPIFLRTWGAGVPIGIILRQIWVGRLFTRATLLFFVAAAVLTLVFLIVARWLADLAGVEESS